VRIVGTKVDPRINNQGRVFHPVFGRKGQAANGGVNAVVQQVPGAKGYFDETLTQSGPKIRVEVVTVLNEFAQRLTRGV
jgi:hypothetical protein